MYIVAMMCVPNVLSTSSSRLQLKHVIDARSERLVRSYGLIKLLLVHALHFAKHLSQKRDFSLKRVLLNLRQFNAVFFMQSHQLQIFKLILFIEFIKLYIVIIEQSEERIIVEFCYFQFLISIIDDVLKQVQLSFNILLLHVPHSVLIQVLISELTLHADYSLLKFQLLLTV